MNMIDFVAHVFPKLNREYQPRDLETLKFGYETGLHVLDSQIESCQSYDLGYLDNHGYMIYREFLPAMFGELPIQDQEWQVQHVLFLALLYIAKNRQISLGPIKNEETKSLEDLTKTLTDIWSKGLYFSILNAPNLNSLPQKIKNWVDSFDIYQPELTSNKKYLHYFYFFISLGQKLMPTPMTKEELSKLSFVNSIKAKMTAGRLATVREDFSSMMGTIKRKYELLEAELAPLTRELAAESSETETTTETEPTPPPMNATLPESNQEAPQEEEEEFLDTMEHPSGSKEELQKRIQQISESYQTYIPKLSELNKASRQLTILSTMLKLETQNPKLLLDYTQAMLDTKVNFTLLSKTLKLTQKESELLQKSMRTPQKKFNPLNFIQERMHLRAEELKMEANALLYEPINLSTLDSNSAVNVLAQKIQYLSYYSPLILESLYQLEQLSQHVTLKPTDISPMMLLENLSLIEDNFKSAQEIITNLQEKTGISEDELQTIISAYNEFTNKKLQQLSLGIANFQMPESDDSKTLIDSIKKHLKSKLELESLNAKIEICTHAIKQLDTPHYLQTEGTKIPVESLNEQLNYLESLKSLLYPIMVSIQELRGLGLDNQTLNQKLQDLSKELSKKYAQMPKLDLPYSNNEALTNTEKIAAQINLQFKATQDAVYVNSDLEHLLDFVGQTSPEESSVVPRQLETYEDFANYLADNFAAKIGIIEATQKGISNLENQGIDVIELQQKFNHVMNVYFGQSLEIKKLPEELDTIKKLSLLYFNFPNPKNADKFLEEIKKFIGQIENASTLSKLNIRHLALTLCSSIYQQAFPILTEISKSSTLDLSLIGKLKSVLKVKSTLDLKSEFQSTQTTPEEPSFQFKPK